MARGVFAIAETRDEAERQVLEGGHPIRILRTRELDLAGLPIVAGQPHHKHWIVVVEMLDPAEEAKLDPPDDPEAVCEREARLMYLKLATDPELLLSGTREGFACPVCRRQIEVELPAPREAPDPLYAACPECGAHLKRRKHRLAWEVARKGQRPTCLFCGAAADSHEHVIPKWISKQLGVRGFLPAEHAFFTGAIEPRSQDISFASYRARIMCTPCNTHFKHLEDAVIPLLVPMARGRSVSLNPETQCLLALWAHKTAIGLVHAVPELHEQGAVPLDHRKSVRYDGRPGAQTWVSFLPWSGSPVVASGISILASRSSDMDREAYGAFLAFAGIAFYVVGFVEELDRAESIEHNRLPFHQCWPQRSPRIDWPTCPPVDNQIVPSVLELVPLTTRGGRR